MNSQKLDKDSLNYINKQYTAFVESAVTVSNQAVKTYIQAWNEFLTSPTKLYRRNMDYFQEIITPPRPEWQTPHRLVALPREFEKQIKLLDFSQDDIPSDSVVPTLVLPPQAGHHSYIADYSHDQSQVQTLRHAGLGAMYCIEWVSATRATGNTTVEDYMRMLKHIVQMLGGKVNLVGDCQGGWLSAIFAAMYPDMVNTLSIAGAPINFQAGDGPIVQQVNHIARTYPDRGMAFYRNLVAMGGGVLNGNFMVMGFNLMRPQQLPERFLNLYQHMHDAGAVKRFKQMKNWYDYAQNIPGTFYLWLVEHLFRDNELIQGKLVVDGRKLNLADYKNPLFLMGGKRDHITPPVQVLDMRNYVGTAPEHIYEYLVPAGHIGLFMGKDILRSTWTPISKKILTYSQK
ncbi:MAG: alpha/beta fold hydrolase [Chloroflexi bacterium]|uniref:Alpha/beta fold hydrolase n=1 Tax=Candidatus Chlorohelix allophototropha TaxID=3003348 RepID=A0A8T7M6J9_9CHLR|nr:alpha/beta fold hydrolase [Chloroflexota bacterium]WJW69652.1 alpha/beta fold hydrolase [Chloroflexota bacterium L227-S17]